MKTAGTSHGVARLGPDGDGRRFKGSHPSGRAVFECTRARRKSGDERIKIIGMPIITAVHYGPPLPLGTPEWISTGAKPFAVYAGSFPSSSSLQATVVAGMEGRQDGRSGADTIYKRGDYKKNQSRY